VVVSVALAVCLASGGLLVDASPASATPTWSIVSSPNPNGATYSFLHGVSCSTSTRCFAVGYYYKGSAYKTLVERWNGTRWSIVSSPNPTGATERYLYGVSCSTSTRCFAVGYYYKGSATKVLVERWNGTRWSIVSSPSPTGATYSFLHGVSCSTSTRCFAVGFYDKGSASKTLVERYGA